jgi:hypothetical protein
MRDDDALCWLCDHPLEPDRSVTSWHGFGAHRNCVRQEEDSRADPGSGLDNAGVISTST